MKKRTKIVIGLLSGTSVDGIDAVIVRIRGKGTATKVQQLAFQTYPYPRGFKEFLMKNSDVRTARLDDIARLQIVVGELFADTAKAIARKAGIGVDKIDLIGSHGQTIHHSPEAKIMFGKRVRATMQVGDPSVIAKRTGITTVGDFRIADIAVGGSGAPLVPYVDYLLFRSPKFSRALLNIGGIANITALPKNCSIDEVSAFDTGPGNILIDALMKKLYNREFDRGSETALKGIINPSLLARLMKHSYLKQKPPKSTGREMFGASLVRDILRHSSKMKKEDVIATVTEFTAVAIYYSYLNFVKKRAPIKELLASGGGVHNVYLMQSLQKYFSDVRVLPVEDVGFSSDAKEAVCFAILANETIEGNASNIPGATGAKRATILGKICPG
jgi:anhydro-N-acetylmuramic acid kinase